MRTPSLAAITVAAVLTQAAAGAQVSRPASPADLKAVSFETASIKQNRSAGGGSFVGRRPGGRFGAQNATLLELIQFAYDVQPFRVTGGPSWAGFDRWDVVAKLEAPPSLVASGAPDDTLLALRGLLLDRFKLVVRRETQQLPIYALVIARPDGRLGAQISRSAIDCMALVAALNRGSGGAPAGTPAPGGPPCGLRGRVGSIQSAGFPLSEFANLLAGRMQRTVVDRTGLTGTWDFMLTYTPDPSQIDPGTFAPGTQPPPADPNSPSLVTALQEQLGLKLESTRGPVEVFVIDRVERPTED